MALYGLMTDYADGVFSFRPDLRKALDNADAVSESIKDSIDKYIAENNVEAPVEPRYVPVWEPAVEPTSLTLEGSGITSVIWAIGYRADYSWIDAGGLQRPRAPGPHPRCHPRTGALFSRPAVAVDLGLGPLLRSRP